MFHNIRAETSWNIYTDRQGNWKKLKKYKHLSTFFGTVMSCLLKIQQRKQKKLWKLFKPLTLIVISERHWLCYLHKKIKWWQNDCCFAIVFWKVCDCLHVQYTRNIGKKVETLTKARPKCCKDQKHFSLERHVKYFQVLTSCFVFLCVYWAAETQFIICI